MYDKLIESLRAVDFIDCTDYPANVMKDCADAAAALEAMNNIIEQARGERDVVTKRMIELEQATGKLTRERDAAVADLSAVFGEIEGIRQRCGIDNINADEALSYLCGKYCAASGKLCYKEGRAFRCDNFRWRVTAEGGENK